MFKIDRIRKIIEESNSLSGKSFDISIQLLILCSIIAFCIETIPTLSATLRLFFKIFDTFTIIIFTIEYLLRLFVAKSKISFVFSFFGIIDLLAILPFYLTTGLDLRSLRALRFFRLFRTMKLLRYNQAIHRFSEAFLLAKEELVLFGFMSLLILFFSAVGIYYFENPVQPEIYRSIFDSLWWAVATLTTVGYGDIYPVTVGGRLFTFLVLLVGLGIAAVPSGLVASALSEARRLEAEEKKST